MLAIVPVGTEPEPAEEDDDPPEMAGGPIVEMPDPAGDDDPLGGRRKLSATWRFPSRSKPIQILSIHP
jgi:hypothetical protein